MKKLLLGKARKERIETAISTLAKTNLYFIRKSETSIWFVGGLAYVRMDLISYEVEQKKVTWDNGTWWERWEPLGEGIDVFLSYIKKHTKLNQKGIGKKLT